MTKNRLLNIEYAALQGAYWMSFGIIISFAAVFLRGRGCSNSLLGLILALGNVGALLLQPGLAGLADRHRRSLPLLIGGLSLLMALAQLANVFLPGGGFSVAACCAAYVCCIFLIQPLISSVADRLESSGAKINFGVARGIGSLCYALMVAAVGLAVERFGPELVPAAGLAASLFLLLMLLPLARLSMGAQGEGRLSGGEKSRSALQFLRSDPRFVLLLLGLSLRYFSHSFINSFMINIVEELGGGSAHMGALNAYSALLELPAMFFFSLLLRRYSSSALFRFSLVMFAVKAFAVFLAPSIPLLYVAQLTQAFSFALYIPASVQYVVDTVPPADRVKGQAFITATVSLGSILAGLLGGLLLDTLGVKSALLVSALISSLGVAICLPSMKKTEKHSV